MNPPPLDRESALLVRVAVDRDEEALMEIVNDLKNPLYTTILRIVHDRQDAEDILQECMSTIWHSAHQYDPAKGKAMHWMRTIARNKALDRLASKKRFTTAMDSLNDRRDCKGMASHWNHEGPCGHLISKERLEEIQQALESLSMEQQDAIRMSAIDELPHTQIAELLDEPLGTIKARIRRGMLLLRERLRLQDAREGRKAAFRKD